MIRRLSGSLMWVRMSVIKPWATEPNAFWRSREVTASGLPCQMALSIIDYSCGSEDVLSGAIYT